MGIDDLRVSADVATVELSAEAVDALARESDRLVARIASTDDPDLPFEVAIAAQELPEDLRRTLLGFRLHEDHAACLVRGWTVDDDGLGLTPEHWADRPSHTGALRHEITLLLLGSLIGEPFGWGTQQDGRLVHDVLPIRDHVNEQLGSGSAEELSWHTEDAFHPMRGDYLGLLCLRNPDNIPTTLCSVDSLSLSDEHRTTLMRERFTIRPDHSHLPGAAVQPAATAAYELIDELQRNPPRVAPIFGDRSRPYLRLDPYFMEEPTELSDRLALEEITTMISRELRPVALQPGEVLFVDNFRAVHGRPAFTARFDGSDRWMKRINLTRDLRKSRSLREEPESRIIG